MQHAHAALQFCESARGVQHVADREVRGGREGGGVAEQRVAERDEVAAQLGAAQRGGGRAVVREFAQVLAEAAAEVEEERGRAGGGRGGAEAGEDARVGRVVREGEVEEVVAPDARVGVHGPGLLALRGRRKWVSEQLRRGRGGPRGGVW